MPGSPRLRLPAAVLTAAAACALAAPAAVAAPAGLTVVRLASPPPLVAAGTRFRVDAVTRNLGAHRTRRSTTVFLASADRHAGADDLVLATSSVAPLRPRGGARSRPLAAIPLAAGPRRVWLIACAGADAAKHRFPRAGCVVAPRPLRILAPSPTDVAVPSLAGTTMDTHTLAARLGSWLGVAPISYAQRWQRCTAKGRHCTDIPGATGRTYLLIPADVGHAVRVVVTATNASGTRSAGSTPTRRVAPRPPEPVAGPSIAGDAVPGRTISANAGRWVGTPPLAFGYRWRRCNAFGTQCRDIAGARGSTYTPSAFEAGPTVTLRVAVSSANAAGHAVISSQPVLTGLWANPVYTGDQAPDPFVLDDGGRHSDFWEFHTGSRFPILHSTDLVHWTSAGTAFADRPSWAVPTGDSHPWAPSVIRTDGACPGQSGGPCYVMYYVSISARWNVNCIAVATATGPGGPYTDLGPLDLAGNTGEPLGCGDGSGQGDIDPSPFIDANGTPYLYLSTNFTLAADGSRRYQPTISVIPLTPDLRAAASTRIPLFSGDSDTWEDTSTVSPTVENPAMVLHNGTYYLLYSGGAWTRAYGMGYATAAGPLGPFTKSPRNPILEQTPQVASPGGGDGPIMGPHGGLWLAYHGRDATYDNPRTLRLDRFFWQGSDTAGRPDLPVISGPTDAPQPALP